MTSYKGTLDGAEMIDLLGNLFPNMHPMHLEEVLSKGVVPVRYSIPDENKPEIINSRLDFTLLPYFPDPILLTKDADGKIKGLEFHAVRCFTGRRYEIFELSDQKVEFLRHIYEEVKK